MRNLSRVSRLMLVIITALTMVVTNPLKAFATGTWDEGIKNNRIYYVGYMQVVDPTSMDSNGKITVKRFGCDMYATAKEYANTYGQSIVDKSNCMIYDTPNTGYGYACSIGDHVNSTYTGYSISGYDLKNSGRYQLWTCKIGDKLQVCYPMNDGYIVKNWFVESIDTNAYYGSDNFVYFSDGRDMDIWGTDAAQIDNTIMLTSCWPNAWGAYPKSGCDGRIIVVCRENHTLAWDLYVKNDGTKVYGDYDLRTGKFIAK